MKNLLKAKVIGSLIPLILLTFACSAQHKSYRMAPSQGLDSQAEPTTGGSSAGGTTVNFEEGGETSTGTAGGGGFGNSGGASNGGESSFGGNNGPDGGSGNNGGQTILDGAALYNQHCVSCHKPIQQTTVKNKSAIAISQAIDRVGVMSTLKFLSNDEIAAISNALN